MKKKAVRILSVMIFINLFFSDLSCVVSEEFRNATKDTSEIDFVCWCRAETVLWYSRVLGTPEWNWVCNNRYLATPLLLCISTVLFFGCIFRRCILNKQGLLQIKNGFFFLPLQIRDWDLIAEERTRNSTEINRMSSDMTPFLIRLIPSVGAHHSDKVQGRRRRRCCCRCSY